jgi:hypothetical protein
MRVKYDQIYFRKHPVSIYYDIPSRELHQKLFHLLYDFSEYTSAIEMRLLKTEQKQKKLPTDDYKIITLDNCIPIPLNEKLDCFLCYDHTYLYRIPMDNYYIIEPKYKFILDTIIDYYMILSEIVIYDIKNVIINVVLDIMRYIPVITLKIPLPT